MTVDRRKFLICLFFLGLSLGAANQSGLAQQPNPGGRPWDTPLTAAELRSAFNRMGLQKSTADTQQFEALRERLLKQFRENPELLKQNPNLYEQLNQIQGNPELARKFREQFGDNQKVNPETLGAFLKSNQMGPPNGRASDLVPPPPVLAKPSEPPLIVPGGDKVAPPGLPDSNHPFPWVKMGPPPGGGNMSSDPGIPSPNGGNRGRMASLHHEPFHNPIGKPGEPMDARAKSMQQMAALWERNVGPLDETPEIKRAFFELMSGDSGLDLDMKDGEGNDLMDLFKGNSGDSSALNDVLNGPESDWKLPQFELPSMEWSKWFGNSSSAPPSPRSSSGRSSSGSRPDGGYGSFGIGGLGGGNVWWLVLGLAAFLLLGYGIWWYVRGAGLEKSGLGDGERMGAWPVDPRGIDSREGIVKAFEYLSVLLCGPSARSWTHGTIAEALAGLARTREDAAMKLARLYELARYTPLEEPLSRREIIEARHLVCDLAEVSV